MSDHPHVGHYSWPSSDTSDERLASQDSDAVTHHAADRVALERGRTLRLWLAVPIVVASLLGMGVIALPALLVIHRLIAGGEPVSDFHLTSGLVTLGTLVVAFEAALIWAGRLLISDRVSPFGWAVVLALAAVVALVAGVWLFQGGGSGQADERLVVATAWYTTVVSATQLRRSVRLKPAAERIGAFLP